MDKVSNSDIIFGHSQGAILISALVSIHDKLWKTAVGSTSTDRQLKGAKSRLCNHREESGEWWQGFKVEVLRNCGFLRFSVQVQGFGCRV